MNIRIEPASSSAARKLMAELNADLNRRYPDAPIYGIEADTFEAGGGVFAVGYDGDEPVVCGAFRPFERSAEFKRVYVASDCRGRGYAKAMMAFLETEAFGRGYVHAVLETGSGQPEAIALYRSLGWREIPPFGSYGAPRGGACCKNQGDFRHVCFEKRLG
jgi:GNAT superfamily N-acetyltransferase